MANGACLKHSLLGRYAIEVVDTATDVTLKQLIEAAYDFKPYLVVGGPAWLDSDRFDISAMLRMI